MFFKGVYIHLTLVLKACNAYYGEKTTHIRQETYKIGRVNRLSQWACPITTLVYRLIGFWKVYHSQRGRGIVV